MGSEYCPKPLGAERVELDRALLNVIEQLAENAHDVWALQRIQDGWTHGPWRCDPEKRHPCLIPYRDLPESEKVYDRNAVAGTIRAMLALGFVIRKEPSPDSAG
jgi:ryanodine receptor 2